MSEPGNMENSVFTCRPLHDVALQGQLRLEMKGEMFDLIVG